MIKNLSLKNNETTFENQCVFELDGTKCTTLREFYETIAKAMEFPDDFGFTLDSFDEMLNDLSWIEDESVVVFIKNSEAFLEKERNHTKLLMFLDTIDATCEDWKWTAEEYDETDEDEFPPKRLYFVFSESQRIKNLLEELYA